MDDGKEGVDIQKCISASTQVTVSGMTEYQIDPQHTCARVTVVVPCVCVCVCLSVTALAASACIHSGHKQYIWVSRRLFLDSDWWIFKKR